MESDAEPKSGSDMPRLRLSWSEDSCEVWPEDQPGNYKPERLARDLVHWDFGPDYHGPRPATEEEIRGVEGFGNIAEFARKRGVIWYEWPVRFCRSADRVEGRAFDDLRREAAAFHNVMSVDQLLEVLRQVRFRNLPPRARLQSYIF